MDYKLIITERAEELLDNLVHYLIFRLKNEQAAQHLLDSIEEIYERLEENPFQFAYCKDKLLRIKEYRDAVIPDMNYVVIFKLEEQYVYILGIFHMLENYKTKL